MTELCSAFTQKNLCCTNTAHKNGLCKMHSKKTYDECSICYDNMYVKETLVCGHSFCRNCIYKWKGNTCPMCRSPMFHIIHQRDTALDHVKYLIDTMDEQFKTKMVNEHFLLIVLNMLNENIWIFYYDSSYLDILFEYTSYSLRNQIVGWNRQFKLMKSISMRLSR